MTGNAERPLSREFNRFQPGPPNRGGLILPLIDDRLWPGRCKAAVRACCGPSSALSALRGMLTALPRDRRSAREHAVLHALRDRLLGERDGADMAPVIGLTAVARSPIAEEPLRIRVRAMAQILDCRFKDAACRTAPAGMGYADDASRCIGE